MSGTQQTLLWIGAAGMALGALAIAVLGRGAREDDRHHFVASFFVCALAACAYFAMANGQGVTEIGDRTVYYARYIDWLLTTPLLLLGLVLVGLPRSRAEEGRERNGLIASILGADVLMIVTGLLATLSTSDGVRYAWYAISCVAFLGVLGLIYGPVMRGAQGQPREVAGLYRSLTLTLTGLWFVYPVLWLLGTEGIGALSLTAEIGIFAVVDLAAKVGFGLLLVTGIMRLSRSPSEVKTRIKTARAA